MHREASPAVHVEILRRKQNEHESSAYINKITGHMQKPDDFLYFTFTKSISYMTEEFSGTSPTDLPPELQNTKPSKAIQVKCPYNSYQEGCVYTTKKNKIECVQH